MSHVFRPTPGEGGIDADAPQEVLDFPAIFKREFSFVWRHLGRLGVEESDIDDATQKVFLVVHKRLPEIVDLGPNDTGRLRGWLFQIVRRVASDERRARGARPLTARASESRLVAASRERPDAAYEEKAAAEELYAILDAMDESRREVFVLADLEGFSIPEIADATGTNLNTVYGRLRAAREDFERALARKNAGRGARWNH